MAILILSTNIPPQVSGAGVRALRTVKEIAKSRDVKLITRTKNKNLSFPHISILPINQKRGLLNDILRNIINISFLPIKVLSKIRKIEKPELIHSFSASWLAIYIFLYNRFFWKVPFVIEITLLGSDTPGSKRKWWLFRWLSDYCLEKADKIICISPLLLEYMKSIGFASQKLVLIPNSVDSKFTPVKESIKNELKESCGISKDTFTIVTVGGLSKRKGYPLIVDIVRALPESLDFKVISVGNYNSDYQRELKDEFLKKLAKDGKADKMIFLGYQDPLPYLQMSDIFLFASNREGFGTAVIEAMACGLTVICRKIDKITDYIIPSEQVGFIVDSDNPDNYKNKIEELMCNIALRRKIGENARLHIIEHFSLDKIAKKYHQLYDELVSKA